MSSARRYQEDIRRIVGVTEDGLRLDPAEQRMRIPGQRGIYQIGSGETKSGSAPGEDEDGNPVDPVMPDENDDNQNSDGSGTGGTGTDAPGTDGGDFEIDPSNPPPNTNIDDATFGGGWGSGGLSSFTDCESGTCIQIVDRGGYVPPQGWADENNVDVGDDGGWHVGDDGAAQDFFESAGYSQDFSALQNERWVPGFCWQATGVSKTRTAGEATRKFIANQSHLIERTVNIKRNSNGTYSVTVEGKNPSFNPPLPQTRPTIVYRLTDCGGTASEPPAKPTTWPADGCIQLAPNAQGNWQASPRENPADMTARYSAPRSILDLCAPNGDGVQILPGKDGGTVRWNYTQGIFMAVSPTGQRSFGGATEVTQAVAGAVAGGGAIKPVGAPRPGD